MNARIVLDARTATDHFPGISRYVVHLAHALSRAAPDLDIALFHDPDAPARLSLPRLPRVACSASPFSMSQQWIIPRQLRRMQAALYHSPYYLMPYRPGIPAILTCYDLIPLIHPHYFSAPQRLIYRLAHRLALSVANTVLTISEAARADLIRFFHLDPRRIVVTPLAADERFSPQPPEAITAARQKYGLPERFVLYLGSNKPHKNLVRLVQAWKISNLQPPDSNLQSPVSNLQLVIAGHWDERYAQPKQIVLDSGLSDCVRFAGPVSEVDLPALYSGAQLFVFPSLYEGFGLPVLEAMACGAPVACSQVSSLPEVAGDAALMFDPLDVQSIAGALQRLAADTALRADLRERGLARASRFSWERTARETLDVYERVGRA